MRLIKFFTLIVLFFSVGCGKSVEKKEEHPLPKVLVSIAPYSYFVERIAGETVETFSIVPSGVNVHVYEPTIQQLTRLHGAQIWFRMGEPFEKRISSALLAQNPSLKLVDLWEGIPLLEEEEGHELCGHHEGAEAKDLHIWMSPRLAALQCSIIASELGRIFPEHAALYQQHLETLLLELEELDANLREKLIPYKGSALLLSHPSLGYYCNEYGLIQLSIECAGKDPLPQDVDRVLKSAGALHVRAIFTQAGYQNKGAERMAKELHLPIYSIDPYAKDYPHTLLHLTKLITDSP